MYQNVIVAAMDEIVRNSARVVSLPSCSTVGSILVSEEEECVSFFIFYSHHPTSIVLLQVISLVPEVKAPIVYEVIAEVNCLYTVIPIFHIVAPVFIIGVNHLIDEVQATLFHLESHHIVVQKTVAMAMSLIAYRI
jgi:hypothetical protein